MAKLKKSGLLKLDLEDITLIKNVREDYSEVEFIARSIERDGLINPLTVKKNPVTGQYELSTGYTRYYAHEFLVSEGKPYNQVECIVRNLDPILAQLIENLNRKDLTPSEEEAGIQQLIDSGMSQTEIASRFKKRITWVSDTLAAGKTRNDAEAAGINTEGISTTAMSQLRNVPEDKLPEIATEVKNAGGTVKAAKRIKQAACGNPVDSVDNSLKLKDYLYDSSGRKVAYVNSITEDEAGIEKNEYGLEWLI